MKLTCVAVAVGLTLALAGCLDFEEVKTCSTDSDCLEGRSCDQAKKVCVEGVRDAGGSGKDAGSGKHDAGIQADAGTDTGIVDTGQDTGNDTGNDVGFDAGIDANVEDGGVDAGTDAETDSGLDAAEDAGTPLDAGQDVETPDTGDDAGGDAGADAAVVDSGTDAGSADAGQDAGIDAGSECKNDNECPVAHGSGRCNAGVCEVKDCLAGYGDCDQTYADGCEITFSIDPRHCGDCATDCGPHSICNNKSCACENGHDNCNVVWSDGCETDLGDPATCGTTCANKVACAVTHGTPGCSSGSCFIFACDNGFADCDTTYADGCEIDLNDPATCGTTCANRIACSGAGGSNSVCTAGVCGLTCNPGRADCNATAGATDGCEIDLNAVPTCGAGCAGLLDCGLRSTCTTGVCGCVQGYGDCNGTWSDGCETDFASTSTCGTTCADKAACAAAHGTPACQTGVCAIAACDQGYADCNAGYGDGCEIGLNDIAACGTTCANRVACSGVHGTIPTCASGVCTLTCDTGWKDCNSAAGASDGCETHTDLDLNNCGACGNACDQKCVVTRSCAGGACDYDLCSNARCLDTDGDRRNGCEVWNWWPKEYGGYSAKVVRELSGGGYAIASFNNGGPVVWRLDPNGAVVWEKNYPTSSNGYGNGDMRPTSDGGFILTAGTSQFGATNDNPWVLKLNANGDVSWQYRFASPYDAHGRAIQQTADGGYVLASTRVTSGVTNVWILKLDSTGTITWQKTYGGSDTSMPESIVQTADGGYTVAGRTKSFGTGTWDAWVLKLDTNGSITWQNIYGTGNFDEEVNSIKQTSDGGFIVGGNTYNQTLVFKLDAAGALVWSKSIPVAGSTVYAVSPTSDGGYIVASYESTFGAGGTDAWVIRLNAAGGIVWQRIYGGTGSDGAGDVLQTSDGGYIVAGWTSSFGNGAWVLKLNPDGTVDGACPAGIGTPSTKTITDMALTVTGTTATVVNTTVTGTSTSGTPTPISRAPQSTCVAP